MPDSPVPKRRPAPLTRPPARPRGRSRYAELRCKTNFSFLEGASHPDELVRRAAELGLEGLAIADRNSLAGVVRAHAAAKQVGLKLLIGAEVTPEDVPPVVLFATDRAAYGRLSRLLTVGRRRAPKGKCRLSFSDIAGHAEGLLACVPLSALPASEQVTFLRDCREVFGDRCYAVAELHCGPDDDVLLERMRASARAARVPLVAANDVHYHTPERRYLQDVLTAIRERRPVAELDGLTFANGERHLKSPEQMGMLFSACPEAVARTAEVADRCRFDLAELRYQYPEELCPPGLTPAEHLHCLTWQGARNRYPAGVPEKVRGLLDHELRLIAELHYEPYFLTVWDLVRFAREKNILCQGRGSAANSAVCFCLGITPVDPERSQVLFERFISRERNEAPDIDVDFEHQRREEVLQYAYEKYGRERCAMTATVITYRGRSAVRDVGFALGLSADRVDVLAKSLEPHGSEGRIAEALREAGLDPASPLARRLLYLVRNLLGFPRHLSQHVGGLVITRDPLSELVPIENASMAGRTVVQWDKDDIAELGMMKVDCLALGMLSAIHRCFDLVEKHYGRALTLATVPQEDPAVYRMIRRADTMGVFQVESRAQMAMAPRMRPKEFYDLVVQIAIVRPGPIQGDMVHPYLRRRSGDEEPDYPDERVKGVLERTLGVPIFQEQCMALAVVAAGFTAGEADQLRRAMAGWRRPGVIDRFERKLNDGMLANGYSPGFAERVCRMVRGFGEYGFPESHAAAFAALAYVSAWLKRHYPAALTAALLNSQPMGFYHAAQLVTDARKHGVRVQPIDVNASDWDCTLEATEKRPLTLRLGFRLIDGLPQAAAERIVRCRGEGRFHSFDDFSRRTGLSSGILERLSRAAAFASLSLDRRQSLWRSLPRQEHPPLFAPARHDEFVAALPPLSARDEVSEDHRTTGLSLRGHPFTFLRRRLGELGVVTAAVLGSLPADRKYKVAGKLLLWQRPGSAKGITFGTIEDETGLVNLIVHEGTWGRFRKVALRGSALLARGMLQREYGVTHLVVDHLKDLSAWMAGVPSRPRMFH